VDSTSPSHETLFSLLRSQGAQVIIFPNHILTSVREQENNAVQMMETAAIINVPAASIVLRIHRKSPQTPSPIGNIVSPTARQSSLSLSFSLSLVLLTASTLPVFILLLLLLPLLPLLRLLLPLLTVSTVPMGYVLGRTRVPKIAATAAQLGGPARPLSLAKCLAFPGAGT
jgi:hypothetical protein